MKKYIIIGILLVTFTSCNEINKTPKVVYPKNEFDTQTEIVKDTAYIEISDLPIHLDSTKYLIHPIGKSKIHYSSKNRSYISKSYRQGSFSISASGRNSITGNLTNLKFQHINSEVLKPLTEKVINIQSVNFLENLFDKTKQQILIYVINDLDTNNDKKINSDDIKSLYISNIDGTNFKKITKDYHELIDWETIIVKNRLYFKSISDSNKNGEFDKGDEFFYQYLNLNDKKWTISEYNPIQ